MDGEGSNEQKIIYLYLDCHQTYLGNKGAPARFLHALDLNCGFAVK